MPTTIYYICEVEAQKFHFFEKHDEAKAKEKELEEKYGNIKLLDWDLPKYQVQSKRLKKYYGTVWLAIKWSDMDRCAYLIHDHYNAIKDRKNNGYAIKKFVLTPYEEYMKQFEDNDEDIDLSGIPPTALF